MEHRDYNKISEDIFSAFFVLGCCVAPLATLFGWAILSQFGIDVF